MTNPASTTDIESRWRPLTSAEATVAQTRLDDGWRDLRREFTDLEQRITVEPDLGPTVAQVLADAVIRLLRNPEGYVRGSVSVDDASRTWDYGSAGRTVGELFFTDAELAKLSMAPVRQRQAFSVMPS